MISNVAKYNTSVEIYLSKITDFKNYTQKQLSYRNVSKSNLLLYTSGYKQWGEKTTTKHNNPDKQLMMATTDAKRPVGLSEPTHPSSQRSPHWKAWTEVPQDTDHDDTGAQSVGPGLEKQTGQTNVRCLKNWKS